MSVPQRLFCWIVLGLCTDGNILLLLQLRLFNQSKKTKAVEHALDAVNLVEVIRKSTEFQVGLSVLCIDAIQGYQEH